MSKPRICLQVHSSDGNITEYTFSSSQRLSAVNARRLLSALAPSRPGKQPVYFLSVEFVRLLLKVLGLLVAVEAADPRNGKVQGDAPPAWG